MHIPITPAIALLLIILGLLLAAVVQWSRYLKGVAMLKETAEETQRSIAHLIAAMTEDFDGTDVRVSLREAKHFATGDQHLVHNLIDEMRREMGLPPVDWPDREKERRKWLATYHNSLTKDPAPEPEP